MNEKLDSNIPLSERKCDENGTKTNASEQQSHYFLHDLEKKKKQQQCWNELKTSVKCTIKRATQCKVWQVKHLWQFSTMILLFVTQKESDGLMLPVSRFGYQQSARKHFVCNFKGANRLVLMIQWT